MTYRVTKKYGHDLGLSACFRQWRADHSHCQYLHGYALAFTFVFECETLDDRNWCIDFGGLKELKERLQLRFDHKLCLATDDPMFESFVQLRKDGLARLHIMTAVGCESFAELAYDLAVTIVNKMGVGDRVKVISCECAEHGANSAIYIP